MSSARPPAKPVSAPVSGPVQTAIAVTSSSTRSGGDAAGQRQPVHHGELDDDGGEQRDGEDDGGQRLAPRRRLASSGRDGRRSPGSLADHHPDHAEAGEVGERLDERGRGERAGLGGHRGHGADRDAGHVRAAAAPSRT